MNAFFSHLIFSALLSANPGTATPNTPANLSFGASSFVTVQNKIWVAVEKSAPQPVVILLRNTNNEVLYQRTVGKKENKYAVKLDVSELSDGQYELEFRSPEGSIRKTVRVGTPKVQEPRRQISMN
ncbi:hypothetical protein [Larkinella soli]|uniref:hypothetical protein n=1 Tax=Larkinella soli TaxID=1770527 RepID=UPI000FFBCF9A|nr:hypothetical protein [Larkinella soli]